MLLLLFALVAAAQTVSTVPAQNALPDVVIGRTAVRIGMQVDAAIAQLQTEYKSAIKGLLPLPKSG
jgi:hypothetical protein